MHAGYFTTNAARMGHPAFRAQGLPIGSEAVESAARHVLRVRMKQPGMRWSKHGGGALLALSAYRAGNRPLPLPEPLPRAACNSTILGQPRVSPTSSSLGWSDERVNHSVIQGRAERCHFEPHQLP